MDSSLKSAYFSNEHKYWLCLLEASDHSWSHSLLFSLIKCTHTYNQKRLRFVLDSISVVHLTALHTLLVLIHTTDTHTVTLYTIPGGPPKACHQCDTCPAAQCLEDVLNSLHKPTLVQRCWQLWLCEQLTGSEVVKVSWRKKTDQWPKLQVSQRSWWVVLLRPRNLAETRGNGAPLSLSCLYPELLITFPLNEWIEPAWQRPVPTDCDWQWCCDGFNFV